RTSGRAHVAGDTLDPALLIAIEPVHAAVIGGQNRPFLGELHRYLGHEHMLHGRLKAGQNRRQVQTLREPETWLLHPFHIIGCDGHDRTFMQKPWFSFMLPDLRRVYATLTVAQCDRTPRRRRRRARHDTRAAPQAPRPRPRTPD